MTRAPLALALVATGCGRIYFDPRSDASGLPGDGTAALCAHTFCDDFDRAGPPEATWDNVVTSGGATEALATDQFISSPASYRVTLAALEGSWLEKQLPQMTASVVVHMQLQIATGSVNDAEIDLLQLQWQTPPAGCDAFGYYLVRDGTMQFNLQETYGATCGGYEQNYLPLLDNTGWHDAVMTVTAGAMGIARIKLELDGTTVIDHTTSHAIIGSTLLLRLGAGASRNIIAPWSFYYDDLAVDVN